MMNFEQQQLVNLEEYKKKLEKEIEQACEKKIIGRPTERKLNKNIELIESLKKKLQATNKLLQRRKKIDGDISESTYSKQEGLSV